MQQSIPFLRWFEKDKKRKSSITSVAPEALYVFVIVMSFNSWPTKLNMVSDYIFFAIWALVAGMLFALAIDNERTMLLKNEMISKLLLIVLVYRLAESVRLESFSNIPDALFGTVILGGFPYLLFQISQGKWIGGGDVKLGFVAGLLLGWKLALVALALWVMFGLLAFLLIKVSETKSNSRIPSGVIWVVIVFVTFLYGEKLISLL